MSPIAAGADGFEAPSVSDFWKPIFGHGAYAFTTAALFVLVATLVISITMILATRRLSVVPTKGQFVTESFYGLVRNSVARDVIGSHDFLKFVPLLLSLFTLILLNNFMGVVPPFLFPPTSRIGIPIALTLIVFLTYHAVSIRKHGLGGWITSMVPPGLGAMAIIIFPLELITYFFTRPVTLALRLFGNMFAGHLLLLLFITGGQYLLLESSGLINHVAGGVAWVMGLVMTVFEILVEFLQAYIFTLLTALYIAGSLADEH